MGLDKLIGPLLPEGPSSKITTPAPASVEMNRIIEAQPEVKELDEKTILTRIIGIRKEDSINIELPTEKPNTQELKGLLDQHEYSVIGRASKLVPDLMSPVINDDPILGTRIGFHIEDFMTPEELQTVRHVGALIGEEFQEIPDYDNKSRAAYLNASRRALHAQALMMYGGNIPPQLSELNSSFTLNEYQASLKAYAERLGIPLNLLPTRGQYDYLRQIDEKRQAEGRLQQNPQSARDIEREEDRKDALLGLDLLERMQKMKGKRG